jgi:hypothetical protein
MNLTSIAGSVHGYTFPAESGHLASLDLLGMGRLRRFICGGAHHRRRYWFQGVAGRDGAGPGIFPFRVVGFRARRACGRGYNYSASTGILLLREFVFKPPFPLPARDGCQKSQPQQ